MKHPPSRLTGWVTAVLLLLGCADQVKCPYRNATAETTGRGWAGRAYRVVRGRREP